MLSNFKCVDGANFGRYLISEKNFNQGDVVWEERPLISGPAAMLDFSPGQHQKFTCVSCHKEINIDQKCPRCYWPCCSTACSHNENHQKFECKIFTALGIDVTDSTFRMLIYLRMLLCKEVDPGKYAKFLTIYFKESEEDEEFRKNREEHSKIIWAFLAQDCQMTVTMQEVSRVYSAFQSNNFEFSHRENGVEYNGEASYLYGSIFANSCQPNLECLFIKTTQNDSDIIWNIHFIAREAIKQGDILTTAYSETHLKFGTIIRQGRIFRSHHFVCMCSRCKDKTEDGTFLQALVCSNCEEGNLLPMDAINAAVGLWSCDKCNFSHDAHEVICVLENLEEFPYSLLDQTEGDDDSLKLADEYVETKSTILHPNHFLMNICAMHWLLESDFTDDLMSRGKSAETLFVKIIKRVDTYLTSCLKFMPSTCSGDLLMVVAKVYAAYTLKSANMITFKNTNYPVSLKLRLCRQISAFIEESLVWKRLNPYRLTYESLKFSVFWSQRVKNFEEEIRKQEELALMSIRYLFY